LQYALKKSVRIGDFGSIMVITLSGSRHLIEDFDQMREFAKTLQGLQDGNQASAQ
jgi:hypothetical protein